MRIVDRLAAPTDRELLGQERAPALSEGQTMPRYFFNVYDGTSLLDEDGTVLPDHRAAQLAAIAHAGEILQDEPQRIAAGEDWRMEVVDEAGVILFRLDFRLLSSSAVTHEVSMRNERPQSRS